MIERPRSEFKNTTSAHFKHISTGHEISQDIYFDYADWHLPLNIIDFADLLKRELENGPSKLAQVRIYKSDVSVYLICIAAISGNDDLYVKFKEINASIMRAYRTCLHSLTKPPTTEGTRHKDDTNGVKWWVRYVAVPLVGSGAFAALVAWFVAKGIFG